MTALDLLLVGGRVIDPSTGFDGIADLGVSAGRIAEISSEIDPSRAREVIDARGRIVAPGLVDLHTHVLGGVIDMAADPDVAGVLSGVTSVIDAGSAGPSTMRAFADRVIPGARTRIRPFMHIAKTGLATRPDIAAASDVDFGQVEEAIGTYDGLLGGLKVRMVNPAVGILGVDMLRRTTEIAHAAGLPVMVHVGDLLQQAGRDLGPRTLEVLGRGDIVTHVFTPHPGGVLDESGTVFPEVFAAMERGVLFDTAHGRRNLSFDVARRVLEQGVPVCAISTDMTRDGLTDVVFSMTEVMSRYLALGFTVAEVIALSSTKPAVAAGLGEAGSLRPGVVADISVLALHDGEWTVSDSLGERLTLTRMFTPALTVRAGEVILPGPGPHPSGWTPPQRQDAR